MSDVLCVQCGRPESHMCHYAMGSAITHKFILPQPTAPAPLTMQAWKRYDLEETSTGYDSYRDMVEREDGDWIRFEDAEAYAAARCQPLLDRIKILEDALKTKTKET